MSASKRLLALLGFAVGATSACHDYCTVAGTDIRPPAEATVVLHQSIVLQASAGGQCLMGRTSLSTGPQGIVQDTAILMSPYTQWRTGDSTIVSIVVLDASHARITGAAAGTAAVTAFANGYRASTTVVTVK
jgi:hypothetical protein